MNAVPSPLQGGPGDEADPSMEEILASIRRIIADEHGAPIPSRSTPAAAPDSPRLKPEPRGIDYPERMPRFEATPRPSPVQSPARLASEASVRTERLERAPDRPPPWPAGQPAPRPTPARPSFGGDRLMSAEADASVASAFDKLSRSLSGAGAGSMDETVREMLRPMLKQWLDDNLPTLVERLVRAEIERVARGGR